MKRILSIAAALLLVLLLTLSAAAATTEKEWTRMTGPAEISLSDAGITCTATEGVSFYKYTKDVVDVRDFTCRFTLEQENYWDGHDGGSHQYYYSILLTNKAAHSGSQGLFLLLFPTSGRSLRIEGQILNTGYLLSPSYVEFDVDTTAELVMHGKVVDDEHYEITFDNCKQAYKFEIPVNYQFHTDLDGDGYFAFGASVSTEGEKAAITVSKVNDLDFTGSQPTATTTAPAQTDANAGVLPGNTGNTGNAGNTGNTGTASGGSLDSSVLLLVIIALAVLFTVAVGGFVFLILFLNRRLPQTAGKKDGQ